MLTFYARHSCTYSMSLCFSDISSDERLACLLHTTFMHTQILYTHTSTHGSSPHAHTKPSVMHRHPQLDQSAASLTVQFDWSLLGSLQIQEVLARH